MSWIAITDGARAMFNIRGMDVSPDDPGARGPAQPDEILPKGTLVVEWRSFGAQGTIRNILNFRRNQQWLRALRIRIDESDMLTLLIKQGQMRSVGRIACQKHSRDGMVRLTYTWDAPHRVAFLTLEHDKDRSITTRRINDPVPLPVNDIRTIVRNGGATELARELRLVAVSDRVEPVGFAAGIAEGTPVETPDGPVPVERLRLGDLVTTAASGSQPVRWISKRTVPTVGGFRPIRLRAPFFGLKTDVVVLPEQRVRLEHIEKEYMLGQDEVLLPAGHLADGTHARREGRRRLLTCYQVLLDVHDCLLHDGIWTESLFVDTAFRNREFLRISPLSGLSLSALPQHRDFSQANLTDFEARSLVASLNS